MYCRKRRPKTIESQIKGIKGAGNPGREAVCLAGARAKGGQGGKRGARGATGAGISETLDPSPEGSKRGFGGRGFPGGAPQELRTPCFG